MQQTGRVHEAPRECDVAASICMQLERYSRGFSDVGQPGATEVVESEETAQDFEFNLVHQPIRYLQCLPRHVHSNRLQTIVLHSQRVTPRSISFGSDLSSFSCFSWSR